jgi:hypothetical protein
MIHKTTKQALDDAAKYMESVEWHLKISAPNYDPTPQDMQRIRYNFAMAKNQLDAARQFYAEEVYEREKAEKAEIERKKQEAYQLEREADYQSWQEGIALVQEVIRGTK